MPLKGIRVLELSKALPGSFCTQLLADFGADVIKIEDKGGDPVRHTEPRLAGKGARFYAVNRNKKSMTLDLRKKAGQKIFARLVQDCDVVLDVLRPGTMEKLGLDYESLSRLNPGLIYCALNAFGTTGPMNKTPAHDINISSLAGISGLTGNSGGPPAMSGVQISALGGSLYAIIAILMALVNRNKTGRGQFCDVSMMDASINLLAYTLAEWSVLERPLRRGCETLNGGYSYFNIYETRDGKYLSLGASESKFWKEFCDKIGRPEYIAIQKKPEMQEKMMNDLRFIMRQKTRSEWQELFAENDICLEPVLSLEEVVNHPQVIARETIQKLNNFEGSGKNLAITGLAVKLYDTPGRISLTFPEMGQHTEEILLESGYSCEAIQTLKNSGII